MTERAQTNLCLHRGARLIEEPELLQVKAPPAEGRWFPLSHGTVWSRVRETLTDAGYSIRRQQLALSRGDHRFFGVMDLDSTLVNGVTLAVGVRNSTDQSFPIGFAAGQRVFCCDNLAFRSELMVKRKHTRNGEQRFVGDIAAAVVQLGAFKDQEAARVRMMQTTELPEDRADALILRGFEKGIISAPQLPAVLGQWRRPDFQEFEPRSLWSLFNAFSYALHDLLKTNPQRFAAATMRLHGLLMPQQPADEVLLSNPA